MDEILSLLPGFVALGTISTASLFAALSIRRRIEDVSPYAKYALYAVFFAALLIGWIVGQLTGVTIFIVTESDRTLDFFTELWVLNDISLIYGYVPFGAPPSIIFAVVGWWWLIERDR